MEAQGTKIEIGTGSGSAVETVTAAVGFPTIITKNAHGLTDGTVVTLSAFAGTDAALMNGQVVVVKNVTTNTLAVDIDTTGKTLTAANGTLTPVAYTQIGEVTDWDGPGGSSAVIDKTHLLSTRKEKFAGVPDEGQLSLSVNFDPSGAGIEAAQAARIARAEKDFKITYSDDQTATFSGDVLAVTSSGSFDGKVSGSITIEVTGAVTFA